MVQHQGEGCTVPPGRNRDVTDGNGDGESHYDQCAVSNNTYNNQKVEGWPFLIETKEIFAHSLNFDDVDILGLDIKIL